MGTVAATVLVVALTVTPQNSGLLSPPQITINDQIGDQFDPHVDQHVAAYSSAVDTLAAGLIQEIRYYDFPTNTDRAIDNRLPDGGLANDLLSDVDQGRVVFTRVFPGDRTAIMLFDAASTTTTELAPAPSTSRIGVALGAQTVAFVDYSLAGDGTGELMVYDLATASLARLTNDTIFDANPAVSPDGNVISWERCASAANCDVYRAQRSGASWSIAAVTSSLLNERSPDSNGAQIVFERDDLSGPSGSNIVLAPVGGGAETVLEIAGEQYNPSIRGQLVAFESRVGLGNPDLFVVDLATNRLFQITNTPTLSESLNDITVLPNGEVRVVWQAVNETDPFNGNIYGATFSLPAVTPPPSSCLNRSAILEATRFYSPTRSVDGQASFSPAMSFALPSSIPVTAGNAGNKKVRLTISVAGTTLECDYRSRSHQSHPSSPAQLALASSYVFERCHVEDDDCGDDEDDEGDDDDDEHHARISYGPGTIVSASRVRLHIQNGDTRQALTRVRLTLNEACPSTNTSTVSAPLEAGNPIDAPQAAGCSSTSASLMPFLVAFSFLALVLRRPASIRLVARREQRRLPR